MRKRIIFLSLLTLILGFVITPFVSVKAETFCELTLTVYIDDSMAGMYEYDLSGSLAEIFNFIAPDGYQFTSSSYPVRNSDGGAVIGSLTYDSYTGGLGFTGDNTVGWCYCDVYLERIPSTDGGTIYIKQVGSSNYFVADTFNSAPYSASIDITAYSYFENYGKYYVDNYTYTNCSVSQCYISGHYLYINIPSMSYGADIYVDITFNGYYPSTTPTPTSVPTAQFYMYGDNNGRVYITDFRPEVQTWAWIVPFNQSYTSSHNFTINFPSWVSLEFEGNLIYMYRNYDYNFCIRVALSDGHGLITTPLEARLITNSTGSAIGTVYWRGTPPVSATPSPSPTLPPPTPTPIYLQESHFQGFLIDNSSGSILRTFDFKPFDKEFFEVGDSVYITLPESYYFSEDDFPLDTTNEMWTLYINSDGSDTGEQSLLCIYSGPSEQYTNSFVQIPIHFDMAFVTPTPSPAVYPWTKDGYFSKRLGDKSYKVPNKIGLDTIRQFDISQFSIPFNNVITYCMGLSFNLLWFFWLIPICVIIGFFIKNH